MDGPPPPGWEVHESRSTGKKYYFNPATGQSLYEHPSKALGTVGLAGAQPAAAASAAAPAPSVAYPDLAAAVIPPAASLGISPKPQISRPAGAASVAADAAAASVARAYDHVTEHDREQRTASRIYHLRNFQNWVKAMLIKEACPRGCASVLDLACGKLGDLLKWQRAGCREYVGVDIAPMQVERAARRLSDSNGKAGPARQIRGRLACADLGATDLGATPLLRPGEQFQAISIQFALHYLFQSESRALTFFRNIADRLEPNGVFVGTIPDANVLVRRLRDEHARLLAATAVAPPGDKDPFQALHGEQAVTVSHGPDPLYEQAGPPEAAGLRLPHGVSFGNPVLRVRFPAETVARQYAAGGNPFGMAYSFFLTESVVAADAGGADGAAGPGDDGGEGDGVLEYLVPWALLLRLARSVGLVPVFADNFHDYCARHLAPGAPMGSAGRDLLRVMRVFDDGGSLSPEEWEVAGLYRVFAFRRDPALSVTLPRPVRPMVGQPHLMAPMLFPTSDHILTVFADGSTAGGGIAAAPAVPLGGTHNGEASRREPPPASVPAAARPVGVTEAIAPGGAAAPAVTPAPAAAAAPEVPAAPPASQPASQLAPVLLAAPAPAGAPAGAVVEGALFAYGEGGDAEDDL